MRCEFMTRTNVGALHALCTGNRPEFASANAKRARWWDWMFARGLRGWIAFDGDTPAGYVEYMPVEIAPHPIAGSQANYLSCLWVLPEHRLKGIGGSLLAACVSDSPHGVATMAYDGERMPAGFFKLNGFRQIDTADGACFLVCGPADVRLEPARYCAHEKSARLAIDVLYNPQCPRSIRVADLVTAAVEKHSARAEIDLWVGDTWACGTRLGLWGGVYFNGVAPFSQLPSEEEIARAIENALTVRVASDL
jgi:GNAT superfamily N-acetyltransferase